MQSLEVSGAVRPIYGSLGVKRIIWCCGSTSRVVCESDGVQLRPAVGVLVVPYSVTLARNKVRCLRMNV